MDFVARAGRALTAIEVKSGRTGDAPPGMEAFTAAFKPARRLDPSYRSGNRMRLSLFDARLGMIRCICAAALTLAGSLAWAQDDITSVYRRLPP